MEKKNESTAEKRAISIREKVTFLSTIVVKLKGLFQDPEKDTRSKALFKKVKSVSELQQQLQQLQSITDSLESLEMENESNAEKSAKVTG